MINSIATYDNPYAHNNVYGHAFELLKRNFQKKLMESDHDFIHIDFGCGYGRIAEPLTAAFGTKYIGFDFDVVALKSISDRGFEAHQLDFSSQSLLEDIKHIIGGRKIGSLSMLDTLEHLQNGDEVLAVISQLASMHNATVVIGVPNVAHRDIGYKLACGSWDYTPSGLLDHTHVRLFNEASLAEALKKSGLYIVDNNNVRINKSDQHFPSTHSALSEGTQLNIFLNTIRNKIDKNSTVNQFVCLCVAGPHAAKQVEIRTPPFLTIITRTQGKRIQSLIELFTCLAGQSCRDFDVIIVGHKLAYEVQLLVERVIEDNPEWLRGRIQLLLVDDGNRTRPLNEGFQHARGDYISILDDDDIPMAHWVETFKKIAAGSPGCILRASVVRQDVVNANVNNRAAIRATGILDRLYPAEFKLLDHLRANFTPPCMIAFPRSPFHDLNIKFDEELTTTEDWDYLMRVIPISGIASSSSVTSVYHWWISDHSSRTEHSTQEWTENYQQIMRKMEKSMMLFPSGFVKDIRQVLDERDFLRSELDNLIRTYNLAPIPSLNSSNLDDTVQKRVKELHLRDLLLSNSWRISGPLRLLGRLSGGKPVSIESIPSMSLVELDRAIYQV